MQDSLYGRLSQWHLSQANWTSDNWATEPATTEPVTTEPGTIEPGHLDQWQLIQWQLNQKKLNQWQLSQCQFEPMTTELAAAELFGWPTGNAGQEAFRRDESMRYIKTNLRTKSAEGKPEGRCKAMIKTTILRYDPVIGGGRGRILSLLNALNIVKRAHMT